MKRKRELLHEREELYKVFNVTNRDSWARVRAKGALSVLNWILEAGHWTPSAHYHEHCECTEATCILDERHDEFMEA